MWPSAVRSRVLVRVSPALVRPQMRLSALLGRSSVSKPQRHFGTAWLMRGLIIACAVFAADIARASDGYEVYVSNEKDATISVIDSDKLAVVRTFSVGKRPRGITFAKNFQEFFVCASDENAVQVFDVGGRLLHNLPSGEDPEQFALSPDGKRLYVANEDDALTTVIDVATRQVLHQVPVGVEPEGMAVSPDNSLVAATSETTNMVHFIDAKTHEVIANILVDARPRHVEFSPDGRKLWVSSEIGGTAAVIDVATRTIERTISFSPPGVEHDSVQPVGILLTQDGGTAFVALGPANRVAVIDTKTYTITNYLPVGQRVWHLALAPDGQRLFTTNGASGDVTVIDVKTLRPIKSIKVGRYPWGVAVRHLN